MKLFIILIMFLGLSSCSTDKSEGFKDVETVEEIEKMTIPEDLPQVFCKVLTSNENGLKLYKEKPFSGTCYSLYPTVDQKYEEYLYLNGEIQWQKMYAKNGDILTEYAFKDGVRLTDVSFCDCTDLTIKTVSGERKSHYKNQVFSGSCRSYYPTVNQAYIEEYFKNGLRHGKSVTFDKNGKILTYSEYVKGIKQ